jgi:hypothetical protein
MKKTVKEKKNTMGPASLPIGSYRDVIKIFKDQLKETPPAFIKKVADELEKWVDEDPDAYKFNQFLIKHKISCSVWKNWLDRNERLQEAYSYALMSLGNKRELGGLHRKLDVSIVHFTMPMYDKQWREEVEWKSNLTKKENAASVGETKFIFVNAPEIPNSPLVKPKVEE